MVRIATENSKQHHKTPDEFMAAIGKRFGPVVFDLAADRSNFRHARYFAPSIFKEVYDPSKISPSNFIAQLVSRGAYEAEIRDAMARMIASRESEVLLKKRTEIGKYEISVPNLDIDAVAYDSFAQDWAALTKEHGGFLFLNPEFKDIDPWAEECVAEGKRGADVLLLVPAAVGANWFLRHVYGRGDRFYLNGRIAFIAGEPYPKDCMLVRFWEGMTGRDFVWSWKSDVLHAGRSSPSLKSFMSDSKMANKTIVGAA